MPGLFRSSLLLLLLLTGSAAFADPAPQTKLVMAARVLDVRTGHYLSNGAVLVDGDRIAAVGAATELRKRSPDARVIDLGSRTLLPGLIDAHTHVMARIPEGEDGYIVNLATKSQAFRALEGAADARAILRSGFTTIRDVESEGSGCGDAALRRLRPGESHRSANIFRSASRAISMTFRPERKWSAARRRSGEPRASRSDAAPIS